MEIAKRQQNEIGKTEQTNSAIFTTKLAVFINNDDTFNLIKLERGLSIETACKGSNLKSLANEIGEPVLATVLTGLILRASSFFNIGESGNISKSQAQETAFILMDRFPYETIEDFVLMFKNGKAGKYDEKLYNRLDGMIIINWMYKYLEEKAIFRENSHRMLKSGTSNKSNEATKLIEVKKVESLQIENSEERPILDALKEAVDFGEIERKEKEYAEFKKNYLNKNIDEKQSNK